jgi:four helix bundle protein
MENTKSYRDLLVWSRAVELAERLYRETKGFPKEETFGLTSQIRRSGVSIAANIAEGASRNSNGEFIQFIGIAKGSLAELETLIILAGKLEFFAEEKTDAILKVCEEVSKMLSGLKKSLAR